MSDARFFNFMFFFLFQGSLALSFEKQYRPLQWFPTFYWCISLFAHFGTFHSSLVRVRRLVLTTIGTMVFIDDNNLINESGTNTICCL